MNKQQIMEALAKQKSILESQDYSVAYICVYGSQNYDLDIYMKEYQSDLDMKAIVVPTLDDLVRNSKPVSEVIETEWGQCDIKDIRKYFETLLKANPAYVETLFTEYYIVDDKFVNEFDYIFKKREGLISALRAQFLRAMYGMMMEKQKALCHPYPTIAHKIEKFGYDGKQLHHIYRLWRMMISYYKNNLPLKKCFYPDVFDKEVLQRMKLNELTLEEALVISEEVLNEAKSFKDKVLSEIDEKRIDYSIRDEFLKLSQYMIKNKIIIECGGFAK